MSTERASAPELTASILQRAGQIATLPEVALKAVRVVDQPGATATTLSDVLANDPILSARILKIVNSAFYAVRRDVTSVSTAVNILGFNAIRSIVIATSLTRLFRGAPLGNGFTAPELWRHSIAVAVGARMLATKVPGVDPEVAFLCGLMHDIGIIVELQAVPEDFRAIVAAVTADTALTFRAAERDRIGTDHERLGAALCRSWRFPEVVVRAVEFHHRPLGIPSGPCCLTALVHLSDRIAADAGIGYGRTVEAPLSESELGTLLAIIPEVVQPEHEQLRATVDEVFTMLSGAG